MTGSDFDRSMSNPQGPLIARLPRQHPLQHCGSTQHRMAGKVHLLSLGEDPQHGRPSVEVHPGQEHGLELAHLPRDGLHQLW